MSLFQYEALDARGKKWKGHLEATTLVEAKQILYRKQIAAIRVREIPAKPIRLSAEQTLEFTREVARLLKAGIPLYEIFSLLVETHPKHPIGLLATRLMEQMKGGSLVSAAFKHYPDLFDLTYTTLIANAERSGRLTEAFEELTQLLQKNRAVRKQIAAATVYPGLLLLFCAFIISLLLFYVVPSLKELFEGRSLHPFTRFVFAWSDAARWARVPLAALAGAAALLVPLSLRSPKWKKRWQRAIGRLPIASRLIAAADLIRFFRALAALLEGGVPLSAALPKIAPLLRIESLARAFEVIERKVLQGIPLSTACSEEPAVPKVVSRLLALSEEGGGHVRSMLQIAELYEEELAKATHRFASYAQPVLLIAIGLIVGFILLSVLIPLTDIQTLDLYRT
jgi:general secretion pathway protein F/type IV pilus assembly protein PilC